MLLPRLWLGVLAIGLKAYYSKTPIIRKMCHWTESPLVQWHVILTKMPIALKMHIMELLEFSNSMVLNQIGVVKEQWTLRAVGFHFWHNGLPD